MQAQVSILKRSQEDSSLLEHIQRLANHSDRGWALHIHMSKLGARSRSENLVFALDMFRSLVTQYSGRVFILRNSDVICVLKDSRIADIKAGVRRIQMLFHDDPLFHLEQDIESKFCTIYNLNDSFGPFLSAVEALMQEPTGRPAVPLPASPPEHRPELDYGPMDLARLATVIDGFAAMQPWPFIRHQPACLITEDKVVVPVFEEIYTSIPDLEKFVGPGVRLTADRWLFQHLTKVLDRRTLRHLTRTDDGATPDPGAAEMRDRLLTTGNFSINLNVASVLSPEFQAFDASIGAAIRGTVVLEFHKIDMFADLGSYLYVLDFARKRGYRICLDGLSHLSLPFMDRADLGVDLMKVYWTSDMPDERLHLRKLVEHAGEHRVILCRCDTDQAIEYGRSVGVSLFQGKQVDQIMGGQTKAPSFLWSFSAPIATHH
jgi:hypothetical protein